MTRSTRSGFILVCFLNTIDLFLLYTAQAVFLVGIVRVLN